MKPNGVDGHSGGQTTFGCGQRKSPHSRADRVYADRSSITHSALKLRYLIPVVMPSSDPNVKRGRALNGIVGIHPGAAPNTPSHGTPVTSPTKQKIKTEEFSVLFDGPLVAKQGEGWDTMLETVVNSWVECVVAERRGER